MTGLTTGIVELLEQEFSRQAVEPARGRAFGPDLSTGESLSDRTVSFLGRRP